MFSYQSRPLARSSIFTKRIIIQNRFSLQMETMGKKCKHSIWQVLRVLSNWLLNRLKCIFFSRSIYNNHRNLQLQKHIVKKKRVHRVKCYSMA